MLTAFRIQKMKAISNSPRVQYNSRISINQKLLKMHEALLKLRDEGGHDILGVASVLKLSAPKQQPGDAVPTCKGRTAITTRKELIVSTSRDLMSHL